MAHSSPQNAKSTVGQPPVGYSQTTQKGALNILA